ncbi:hypothetical protein VspSw1_148 [Vibrio phage VspSw_1]|uniref:Uncharacterized protein n=2 Tax=Pogseptimavirus VspSw1 TaxID=2733997 RepID=A0A411BKW5_9CAUD|nr:hypothetical protein HOV08_gp148 [Vibrio phage VspSw_1]QAY02216.1 hypothetical protein VspSw1_148 [Vibrio phage VspSw_1]QKN88547.1 hypothetical protein vBValSX1_154 [Vibrio phage vB_ValS_X1]
MNKSIPFDKIQEVFGDSLPTKAHFYAYVAHHGVTQLMVEKAYNTCSVKAWHLLVADFEEFIENKEEPVVKEPVKTESVEEDSDE